MDFFTADLHLDHPNILRYSPQRRGFLLPGDASHLDEVGPSRDGPKFKPSRASIDAMNDGIIDTINAAVGKKDRLWILGDFAVRVDRDRARELRDRIKCKDLRIVWGNHDDRPILRKLFEGCYDAVMIYVPAEGDSWTEDEIQDKLADDSLGSREVRRMQRIYLSHYAHVVWQASHKGVYHLYGHSHGNLEPWREQTIPSALSFDVGVDANRFKPWSFTEIDAILSRKRDTMPPHAVDHHGPRIPGSELD